MRLEGNVVVTGADRGIGSATADRFLTEAARVVAADPGLMLLSRAAMPHPIASKGVIVNAFSEIASVIAFPASSDASFVSGEVIVADGAWTAY